MKNKVIVVLGILALGASTLMAQSDEEETKGVFQGWAELLYRNVSVDGNQNKYGEDFDGLGDGVRIQNLDMIYDHADGKVLDHARLDMRGLGGDL